MPQTKDQSVLYRKKERREGRKGGREGERKEEGRKGRREKGRGLRTLKHQANS